MAEEEADDSQKTEEPSARKLEKAEEEGSFAQSAEIKNWFMLLASLAIVAVFAPMVSGQITADLAGLIAQSHSLDLGGDGLRIILADIGIKLAVILAGVFAVTIVAALASGWVQTRLRISFDYIMPKYSRISLLAGIKRQFSSIALVEFLKGLAKIIIAGWAAYLIIRPSLDEISLMPSLSLPEVMQKIYDYSVELFFIIFIIITFIAALDYSFQRFNYLKNLRMTKQEVKDEAKQAEGSPEIKAKLKQIRMERARRRMMSSVPKATVIITNPTHYAVALYYEVTEMRAPQVVAKGVDRVALKIREIADEHKVPIVENPPLARLLYASVDLDEEIQTDHYKAVAEVISYVYKLRNKTYSLSPEK